MQRRRVRGRHFGCLNSIGFLWPFGPRTTRLLSGYSDPQISPRRPARPTMPYDVDMRETGNRTYFGLSVGPAAALVSALLFGATTPIAKQLLNGEPPLLVAGLLYLGSGVGLALLRLVQDRGLSPTTLKRSDWPWLAAATASGGVLAPALLLLGLTHSDAQPRALPGYSSPTPPWLTLCIHSTFAA